MKNSPSKIFLLVFILLTAFSCTKLDLKKDKTFEMDNNAILTQLSSADFIPHDDDSIERITTVGVRLTNPYLIPNMQQAYSNLGLNSSLATITNLYVRFKPSTVDQLAVLDSTMEVQNLEIFDTPVDYDVTYEGDYYQDPSIPEEQISWQYAVVTPTFQFPAGIQYEIIAQIHIPGDDFTAVETEAERLAAFQDSLSMNISSGGSFSGITPNVVQDCLPGFHWDLRLRKCVPDNCPSGYHWDGVECVVNVPPPPPAADAAIPAGYIYVHDTNLPSIALGGSDLPLRKARVVARRWFKIERVFTDNTGHFVFTKRFKHKVRISEKFKNTDARIYGIRGVRVWQMFFPIKRTFGIFSGDKSNLLLLNNQGGPVNSKTNRYWAGATTHNAVQEHRDYASQFSFSTAPATLNIYITNWGIAEGLASTPLFNKRFLTNLPSSFINTFLVNTTVQFVAGGIPAMLAVFTRVNVDMAVDYHTTLDRFTSDWLKETVYHEMSHASHYTKAGTTWYTQFVNAELAEILLHPSGNLNPYGDGLTSNSPIIALGEGWAYHIGHFLTDQRYGVNATTANDGQGNFNPTMTPPLIAHPHIDVLEFFNPNFTSDPFRWIPKGLMEDLIDNTPNETAPVVDNVNGFTTSQLFNALQSDVTTVPQYRARFIQQNPVNQTANVTNLFAQYHY